MQLRKPLGSLYIPASNWCKQYEDCIMLWQRLFICGRLYASAGAVPWLSSDSSFQELFWRRRKGEDDCVHQFKVQRLWRNCGKYTCHLSLCWSYLYCNVSFWSACFEVSYQVFDLFLTGSDWQNQLCVPSSVVEILSRECMWKCIANQCKLADLCPVSSIFHCFLTFPCPTFWRAWSHFRSLRLLSLTAATCCVCSNLRIWCIVSLRLKGLMLLFLTNV